MSSSSVDGAVVVAGERNLEFGQCSATPTESEVGTLLGAVDIDHAGHLTRLLICHRACLALSQSLIHGKQSSSRR